MGVNVVSAPLHLAPDLSDYVTLLLQDREWQDGFDDEERRMCLNFALEMLALAHRRDRDVKETYRRVLGMLKAPASQLARGA